MGKVHCNGHSLNSSIPYPTELFQFITFDWRPCRRSPKLSFPEWSKYLEEIATAKKLDVNEIKVKLVECGTPGTTGATVSRVSHLNLFFLFYWYVSHFFPDLRLKPNIKIKIKSEIIHGFSLIWGYFQKVVKSTAVDRLTDTSKWAIGWKVFSPKFNFPDMGELTSRGLTVMEQEEERYDTRSGKNFHNLQFEPRLR